MSYVNSYLSIAPEPSLSTCISFIRTSSFFRKMPRAFMASFSSFTSMEPDLSLSNNKKALSISYICSSVKVLILCKVLLTTFFLLVTPSTVTYLYSTNSSFSFNIYLFFFLDFLLPGDGGISTKATFSYLSQIGSI